MTAGEVATETGLGRESVSTMLSKLAKAGELRKASRCYQLAGVEPAQRFYFGIEDNVTPRAVVANLPELEAAIAVCGPGVLRHHCAEHDFSRWVAGVLHNEPLAADIASAEAQLSADSPTETVDYICAPRAHRSTPSSSRHTAVVAEDPSACRLSGRRTSEANGLRSGWLPSLSTLDKFPYVYQRRKALQFGFLICEALGLSPVCPWFSNPSGSLRSGRPCTKQPSPLQRGQEAA
jgi:hypothetical protein